MKIKVREATRTQLNWLVAKCEGAQGIRFDGEFWRVHFGGAEEYLGNLDYTEDWSMSGPIIEREDISFRKYHRPDSESHGTYYARICRENGTLIGWYRTTGHQQTGPTPLIAAMRCYVASRLGNEVDIPEELT